MKLCKTTKKVRVNMFYKTELDYLMKVLSKMHLQVLLIEPGNTENYQVDFGFRKFLWLEDSYEQAFQNSRLWAQANKIYRLQDEFMCKYAFLMLPESPEQQALLVGPYITFEMSISLMHDSGILSVYSTYLMSPVKEILGYGFSYSW